MKFKPTLQAPNVVHHSDDSTEPLALRFFGGFSVARGDTPLTGFAYDKVRALLAFLAIEAGSTHSRERLADLFWPTASRDTARSNLRHALFNLRQVLGPDRAVIVQEGRQALRFERGYPIACDLCRFNAELPARDTGALEAQAALYQGALLERMTLPDAPQFEQWLCTQQEAALRRAVTLHQRLAEHYERSAQAAQALRHVRRLVQLAPWQDLHRQHLMRLLAAGGDCAAALQEFASFQRDLKEELGAAPEPATTALAERIGQNGTPPAPAQAPAPAIQQRLPVTVLACHLRPRQLADPDDLEQALAAPRASCMAAVKAHGGHGVLLHAGVLNAYFGYPRPQEMAPRRALGAALDIATLLGAHGGIDFNIGLDTGWMLADNSYALPDVAGDLSRRSAQLAGAGQPGTVTVSAAMKRAADGYFRFEDYRGADGGTLIRATAKTAALDRLEAAREAERQLTPLIGRAAQLRQLWRYWDSPQAGRAVLIHGDAGVGKSRLMQAAAGQIRRAGGLHFDLRCQPDHQQSPHFPLADFVERHFSLPPDGTDEERHAALHGGVRRLYPELEVCLPALCALLGLPSALDALTDAGARRRAFEQQLLDGLACLGARHALLLTLEDAHWAGPSTLDLLARALQAGGGPRLWLITSRYPGVVANATHVAVGHLGASLATRLARQVCGGAGLAAGQVAAIVARADGMPLYIEQMVRSALDDSGGPIPPTLSDLLASRLEALGPYHLLAQQAAVIGREFDRDMLAWLWDEAGGPLAQGLENMCAVQLVQQQTATRFAFHHALIRDAAYQSLPAAARRAIHARLAGALRRHFARRVADHPELLARHLDAADLPGAAEAWLLAGMQLAARSVQREAITHLRQGLAALSRVDDEVQRHTLEFRLCIHLGNALVALQGYGSAEAQQAYARAQGLTSHLPDDGDLFQLMWGLWLGGRSATGDLPSLAFTEKLYAIGQQSTDPATKVMFNYAYGNNYFWLGQPARAGRHLEAAIAAAAGVDSSAMIARYGEDGGVTSRAFLAWVFWIEGRPASAQAMSEEAVALARRGGHAHSLGFALAFAGVLQRHLDLPDRALEYGRELAQLSEKHALLLWQAVAATVLGWAGAVGGDSAGLDLIRMGVAGAQQAMLIVETTFLSFLADGMFRLGQLDEADAILDDCISKGILREDLYFLAEFHRLKGEILLARTPHSVDRQRAAEAFFGDGMRIAEEQQARILALRLATSLGKLWASQGKRQDAAALLAEHLARFSEGHDYPDLRAASAVLAALDNATTNS